MKFRTEVTIEQPEWRISPDSRLLFVGSCFATNIGQRFVDNQFQTVVNPFGVMYNPISILHTLRRLYDGSSSFSPDFVFLTLGTNHVYRLRETGEIVDNCEKRPHRLFQEEQLTIAQCADALREGAALLRQVNPDVRIILTVSPIRYAKYGFHGSQLSKATLLLALGTWLLGVLCSLSFGPLAHVKLLGLNIFDFLDALCSNWLLPLGGLLFTLFVGWWMSKADVRDELTNGGTCNVRLFGLVYFLMRYLAPVGILVVFLTNLFL